MQFKFQQMTNRTGWIFFFFLLKLDTAKLTKALELVCLTNQEVGRFQNHSCFFEEKR